MDYASKIAIPNPSQVLLRAANDSIRPLSTIEVALKVRPAQVLSGTTPVWRLDPQYDRWLRESFPHDAVWLCPLDAYDRLVRSAAARHSLEELDTRLRDEIARTGGYTLAEVTGWRQRTAMFVVGSHRLKALTEFLFAWG